MDLRALRLSGIVVSGALIGAAAILAMTTRPAPRRPPAPQALAPATAPVEQPSRPAAFAISLRGEGPLARAQRLAMRGGRDAAARRRVERELARQRGFRGLCFQHFTARGEIVVHICRQGRANLDSNVDSNLDWRARLRAMPAVTNVDAASQLTQDQRGD